MPNPSRDKNDHIHGSVCGGGGRGEGLLCDLGCEFQKGKELEKRCEDNILWD